MFTSEIIYMYDISGTQATFLQSKQALQAKLLHSLKWLSVFDGVSFQIIFYYYSVAV